MPIEHGAMLLERTASAIPSIFRPFALSFPHFYISEI